MDNQFLQAIMAQAQQTQTKTIVEFSAGILTQKGTTVTADERKGKLTLLQGEDGNLHLQWTLRPSGSLVLDLILFPKSATWEPVPECKDGRVFLLQFKSSPSNRRFFWMQEPTDEKDKEYMKKINDTIGNPPLQDNSLAGLMGGDFQSMLGAGADRRPATSPATLSGSSVASAADAPSAAPASGSNAESEAMAASFASLAQQLQDQTQTGLNDILNSDRIDAALDDAMIERLVTHLPSSQQTAHDLRETLRSPQFQQTAGRLSSILNSSQFPALMASLSLPHTGTIGVDAFLDAIEEEAKKE